MLYKGLKPLANFKKGPQNICSLILWNSVCLSSTTEAQTVEIAASAVVFATNLAKPSRPTPCGFLRYLALSINTTKYSLNIIIVITSLKNIAGILDYKLIESFPNLNSKVHSPQVL